jgi:hypothetical protein
LDNDKTPLTLFQVLGSVLASFFGVQRDATRRRDFSRGRARDFILVGILLTGSFVLLVWGIVQLVVYLAIPN